MMCDGIWIAHVIEISIKFDIDFGIFSKIHWNFTNLI